MHMGSYKSLSFFKVSDTGWFHTFTKFQNYLDIGWDDVWSRRCFHPRSFRSYAAEITVARLCDNFCVSHLVLQNLNCARTRANGKDAEKMFVPRPLAKGRCIPGVGSKRWAGQTLRSMRGMRDSAHFLSSLLLRWSLQNLILVLTSPYKVLIWL